MERLSQWNTAGVVIWYLNRHQICCEASEVILGIESLAIKFEIAQFSHAPLKLSFLCGQTINSLLHCYPVV